MNRSFFNRSLINRKYHGDRDVYRNYRERQGKKHEIDYVENKKKYSETQTQRSNEFIRNYQYDLEKEETGNYILQNWLSNFSTVSFKESKSNKQ